MHRHACCACALCVRRARACTHDDDHARVHACVRSNGARACTCIVPTCVCACVTSIPSCACACAFVSLFMCMRMRVQSVFVSPCVATCTFAHVHAHHARVTPPWSVLPVLMIMFVSMPTRMSTPTPMPMFMSVDTPNAHAHAPVCSFTCTCMPMFVSMAMPCS